MRVIAAAFRTLRDDARARLERSEVEALADEAHLLYALEADEDDARLAFVRLRLSLVRLGLELVS